MKLDFLAPDDALMSVEVAAGATFKPGVPTVLFRARFEEMSQHRSAYSTRDGQRFLVNEMISNDEPLLTVRTNWTFDKR